MAAVFCLISYLFFSTVANAIPLIRDAEIEETIALYAQPLFKAAGLETNNIEVYIVNDDRLNAFVSNGQKIFIHTGLLMQTETPQAIMGVIAHEAGHIAGGHLAKLREKVDGLSTANLLSYILGAAAAVGGAGDAAIAILTGGQQLGQRTLLAHTRAQERAADSFAVQTLAKVKLPPSGLLETLNLLEQQTLWRPSGQDNPYARSHPLTSERISFVQEQTENSPYKTNNVPDFLQQRHDRMRGKLYGFMKGMPTQHTFPNTPIAYKYATAIAAYKQADFVAGDAALLRLQQQFPDDAYLYETKGQLYLENGGDTETAATAYKQALKVKPQSLQLQQGLARIFIAQDKPEEAIPYLRKVVQFEPKNGRAWQQIASAYGKTGQEFLALLASTELALIRGNKAQATNFLDRAKPLLKDASKADQLHYKDLRKVL